MNQLTKLIIVLLILVTSTIIINLILLKLRNKTKQIVYKFLSEFINIVAVFIGLCFILQQFDFTKNIGSQIIKGSALMIAILTFAAQKALSNIMSGISISYSKAFLLGDKIRITNGSGNVLAEGVVDDITLRHVIIKTYDGSAHTIPNSLIEESVVSRLNPNAKLFIEVGYESDIQKALSIMESICKKAENSIGCGNAYIREYTSNGIELGITVYADDNEKSYLVQTECYLAILKELKRNQIEIPYQTITINKI